MLIAPLTFGANIEKQYKKLIETYDVPEESKNLEEYNPTLFWNLMIEGNELLTKFLVDMEKNRGAEKEAIKKTSQLPRFYPEYDSSIIEEMQGFCDTILIHMGIADLGLNCSLHIVYAEEANAFTALTEDGFAMCVTTGLLNKKGLNYKILMGYIAHEFAHGVLLHHIRDFYAAAKERRKNELIGGIAMGLQAVAAGAEAYTAGAYGIKPSGTDYGRIIDNIKRDVKYSTLKYSYKFSREQEYEADLIAYRFLENLGCGEEYINGLRILGTQYDGLYDEFSDHPTTTSRIAFLIYVKEHPEFGNKKNAKLRKQRTHQEKDDIYYSN